MLSICLGLHYRLPRVYHRGWLDNSNIYKDITGGSGPPKAVLMIRQKTIKCRRTLLQDGEGCPLGRASCLCPGRAVLGARHGKIVGMRGIALVRGASGGEESHSHSRYNWWRKGTKKRVAFSVGETAIVPPEREVEGRGE